MGKLVVGQFEDSRLLNQMSASPSPISAKKTGSIMTRAAMSSVSRRAGPMTANVTRITTKPRRLLSNRISKRLVLIEQPYDFSD